MSSPPTSGPEMVARPITAPKIPKAAPRSRGGKVTCVIARTWGSSSAPISPWTTREPTSIPGLCAKPHSAEAAVKPVTPIRNRRLRPKMSPSRPPVISTAANASW